MEIHRLGLASRLLIPIIVTILFAGSVRTFLVAQEEAAWMERQLQDKTRLAAEIVPFILANHPVRMADQDVPSTLTHFAELLDARWVEWIHEDQTYRYSMPPATSGCPNWFAAWITPDILHAEVRYPVAPQAGNLTIAFDPARMLDTAWKRVWTQAATVAAVVAVLLLAIGVILRSSLRGLRLLRAAAAEIHAGNYAVRARPSGSADIRALTDEFNRMADAIGKEMSLRLATEARLVEKQATLEGVLNSMGESVLLVDAAGKIILANPASTIVANANESLVGKALQGALPLVRAEGGNLDWTGLLQDVLNDGCALIDNVQCITGGRTCAIEGCATLLRQHGQSHVIILLRDVSEMKRLLIDAEWKACHDPLTGLPNRLLLADRLRQACLAADRQSSMVAVCFLDLDGFKPINDAHGHEMGDQVLTQCARRLEDCLRGMDTVVRLGGDEFVVLLTGLRTETQCISGIERILEVIANPYEVAELNINLSASLGFTLFPDDRADPDTLLRHADHAMYLAKSRGRGRWHRYEPEEQEDTRNTLTRLGEALVAGELELFYQPQVNMRTGKVIGCEALMRWRHPERGLLGPGEFLPAAERLPMIDTLGEWAISQALREVECWHAQGWPLTVSVNIAGRHFLSPGFTDRLHALLSPYPHLPPFSLRLEITESSALADMAHAATVVRECRQLKIGVAVDDFGTGYASLAYLRQLPVDEIKIDQHFVRDILDDKSDMALVEAVISLAAVFERQVLAEGVETAEHGVLLLRLGCDLAQGYGIARPMPAQVIGEWLNNWQPDNSWTEWGDIRWELSDFPLIVAQHDHVRWVNRILAYADMRDQVLVLEDLADHHACRFGRWYDTHGKDRFGHLPEYQAIAAIHQEVHELGKQVIFSIDQEDRALTADLGARLIACRAEIVSLLLKLQQAVAKAAMSGR